MKKSFSCQQVCIEGTDPMIKESLDPLETCPIFNIHY